MYTIVCLGDSITCNWDTPSYVDYWQSLCDQKFGLKQYQIISAGVNGETAADGFNRLDEDVLVADPDLITIMYGHNELFQHLPPSQYQEDLHQIIRYLQKESPADIWLLTPNQVADPILKKSYPVYLKTLKAVADILKVGYINLWSVFDHLDLTQIYTYPNDPIHPNSLGHQLLAQELIKHLKIGNLKLKNHKS